METFSFLDIITGKAIKDVRKIVIPKIQRDYAQGRDNQKAADIRQLFIGSLIATLKATDNAIQPLDFIYGYINKESFFPLDGQQRLTTLFLLHWLVLPQGKREILKSENGEAVLSYLTRPSSKDFCNFLININFPEFKEAYLEAVKTAKDNEEELPKLSKLIREQDEYRYSWDFDPTVLSMLTMLDSLMLQLRSFDEISKLDFEKLNNIRFHYQDLPEILSGNDLYVKMNARGLELSDFDNTKSTLESDMLEAKIPAEIQKSWREQIDGPWIDFFWNRAGANNPQLIPDLKNIKKIEEDLKDFILRIKDLKIFEDLYNNTSNDYEESLLYLSLPDSSTRNVLNQNLMTYVGLRFEDIHQVVKGSCPVIDYDFILKSFNNFIYEENNLYFPVYKLVPDIIFPNEDPSNLPQDITEVLIGQRLTYNQRLFFYALFYFLKHFPANLIKNDNALKADFKTWLRIIRNLSLARNYRPLYYDDIILPKKGLENFIDGYVFTLNQQKKEGKSYSLSDYIILHNRIEGINQDNFNEEKEKEILRRDPEWVKILDKFENEGYLFGQLRAPLQWSNGNKKLFSDYANFINRIIGDNYWKPYLYAALLLITSPDKHNYPFSDSLLLFNYSRDWSFKRYLRELHNGLFAPALKKLADIWLQRKDIEISIVDFLQQVIDEHRNDLTLPLWKRQLAEHPEIIEEKTGTKLRGIDKDNNYNYLIDSVWKNKEWNINLCWLKKTKYKSPEYVIHNTKEESSYKDTITCGNLIVASGEYGDLWPDKIPRGSKFLKHKRGLAYIKTQSSIRLQRVNRR